MESNCKNVNQIAGHVVFLPARMHTIAVYMFYFSFYCYIDTFPYKAIISCFAIIAILF